MKSEMNIDVLTYSRSNVLKDSLGGIALQMDKGLFTQESKDALAGIGLTSLEIRLLEEKNTNLNLGVNELIVPVSINDLNVENPWKKETYNLTRQIEITKIDPVLAERLKREAY